MKVTVTDCKQKEVKFSADESIEAMVRALGLKPVVDGQDCSSGKYILKFEHGALSMQRDVDRLGVRATHLEEMGHTFRDNTLHRFTEVWKSIGELQEKVEALEKATT